MERQANTGWHPADIKAALAKKGWTFYSLSRHLGHKNANSAAAVIQKPWPVVQKLIGEIICIDPAEIWPDRYNTDGSPIGCVRRSYPKIREVGNSKSAAVA